MSAEPVDHRIHQLDDVIRLPAVFQPEQQRRERVPTGQVGIRKSAFLNHMIYPDSPGTRETPLPGVATRILPSA
jgi:hypothetical protein